MPSNSLTIVNQDGHSINEAGYINVVENIILDPEGLEEFAGEDDDIGFTKARTKMLCKLANNVSGTGGILQQRDDSNKFIDVSSRTCRVRAQPDTAKPINKGFSKVTVSIPENSLTLAELIYVDDYINKFLSIWNGAATLLKDPGTDPDPPAARKRANNARKFMFGVMMLTKCR